MHILVTFDRITTNRMEASHSFVLLEQTFVSLIVCQYVDGEMLIASQPWVAHEPYCTMLLGICVIRDC